VISMKNNNNNNTINYISVMVDGNNDEDSLSIDMLMCSSKGEKYYEVVKY
jgi:hypothetical protein